MNDTPLSKPFFFPEYVREMYRRACNRWVTSWMLAFGLMLVVLFPFNFLGWVLSYFGKPLPTWIDALAIKGDGQASGSPGWWESVAIIWTVTFLMLFMIFEFPRVYRSTDSGRGQRRETPSNTNVAQTTAILSMGSMIFGGFSLWIFLCHLHPDEYESRLTSKCLLLLWIVVTDILIAYVLNVPHRARHDFQSVLFTIDFPAFAALFIVKCFLFTKHWGSTSPEIRGFASGISAMTLLFINIAFGFQFILESTDAKTKSPKRATTATPKTPAISSDASVSDQSE